MIEVYAEGIGEVVAKLDSLDARMTDELRIGIGRLSAKLQGNVQKDKLSGQVLGVRTGRGRRSIQQDVRVAGSKVTGIVSTNVNYMIGWELGWPGSQEHEGMKAAKAKFDVSASADSFKNGTPKKRSFLVPALKELSESGAINEEISAAIGRAAK
jgi:hypothetical protein